jgi:hypothetical protein
VDGGGEGGGGGGEGGEDDRLHGCGLLWDGSGWVW